eukprot:365104-Chlamydomonas_euryale.AAC.8
MRSKQAGVDRRSHTAATLDMYNPPLTMSGAFGSPAKPLSERPQVPIAWLDAISCARAEQTGNALGKTGPDGRAVWLLIAHERRADTAIAVTAEHKRRAHGMLCGCTCSRASPAGHSQRAHGMSRKNTHVPCEDTHVRCEDTHAM